jgi:hypothetical protein
MKELDVDLCAGCLVFWKATMTSCDSLSLSAEDCGYSANWYWIGAEGALLSALTDSFGGRNGKLVRSAAPVVRTMPNGDLKTYKAAVTVDEKVDSGGNTYKQTSRYLIDEDTFEVLTDDGEPTAIDAKRFKGQVSAANVGAGLDAIVRKCGAYKLRDNARVYFLTKSGFAAWEGVVRAFEANTKVCFFKVTCPADADTAAAIADNAMVELRGRYSKVLESIDRVDATLRSSDSSLRVVRSARATRQELLGELEKIKRDASLIDSGFNGLLSLANEISMEIDSHMAIAVLSTSSN